MSDSDVSDDASVAKIDQEELILVPETEEYTRMCMGDGKGIFWDISFNEVVENSNLCCEKVPNPINYENMYYFKAAVFEWANKMNKSYNSILMPVPISIGYKKPHSPHIPSPAEKTFGTMQNRLAAKTFSVVSTPLYPENYSIVISAALNGEFPEADVLPEKGPRGQEIPISYHLGKGQYWTGVMIPQRPRPQMFSTYEEYSEAMRTWASRANYPIIHPKELEDLLKINVESPDEYQSIQPIVPQKSEPTVCVKESKYPKHIDEMYLKEMLVGLQHVYTSFAQQPPAKTANVDITKEYVNEECQRFILTAMNYGMSEPIYDKFKLKGLYELSKHPLLNRILVFINYASIKDRLDIIDSVTSYGFAYQLVSSITALFRSKDSLKSFISSDMTCYLRLAKLFSMFTCLFSTSYLEALSTEPDPATAACCEVALGILSYRNITLQFLDFYEFFAEETQEQAAFFRTKFIGGCQNVEIFFESIGADFVKVIIEPPVTKFKLALLYLALTTDFNQLDKFLGYFQPTLFHFLLSLPFEDYTQHFLSKVLHHRILSRIVLGSLIHAITLDPDIVASVTGRNLRFVYDLISSGYVAQDFSKQINWLLSLFRALLKHVKPDDELIARRILHQIGIILSNCASNTPKNRPNMDLFKQMLREMIDHAREAKSETLLLGILGAMKHLVKEKVFEGAFSDPSSFLDAITAYVENKKSKVSIMAIKVLRSAFIAHPTFLKESANKDDYCRMVGASMITLEPRKYVEYWKLILLSVTGSKKPSRLITRKYSNNSDYANVVKILRAAKFYPTNSIEAMRNHISHKYRYILVAAEAFKASNSSSYQQLESLEKHLSTPKRGWRKSYSPG